METAGERRVPAAAHHAVPAGQVQAQTARTCGKERSVSRVCRNSQNQTRRVWASLCVSARKKTFTQDAHVVRTFFDNLTLHSVSLFKRPSQVSLGWRHFHFIMRRHFFSTDSGPSHRRSKCTCIFAAPGRDSCPSHLHAGRASPSGPLILGAASPPLPAPTRRVQLRPFSQRL